MERITSRQNPLVKHFRDVAHGIVDDVMLLEGGHLRPGGRRQNGGGEHGRRHDTSQHHGCPLDGAWTGSSGTSGPPAVSAAM